MPYSPSGSIASQTLVHGSGCAQPVTMLLRAGTLLRACAAAVMRARVPGRVSQGVAGLQVHHETPAAPSLAPPAAMGGAQPGQAMVDTHPSDAAATVTVRPAPVPGPSLLLLPQGARALSTHRPQPRVPAQPPLLRRSADRLGGQLPLPLGPCREALGRPAASVRVKAAPAVSHGERA
jgi:hypothetical protein